MYVYINTLRIYRDNMILLTSHFFTYTIKDRGDALRHATPIDGLTCRIRSYTSKTSTYISLSTFINTGKNKVQLYFWKKS